VAVWKELVKAAKPQNMAIFGTSTGGNLTLAMVLGAKDENTPLPAAIAPNAPWADQDRIGDSYNANEWIDNVLVTWDSWLGRAAKLYANGRDLKEPYISPLYGDFTNFPPTILTSGTRDLFLSNVRTHRKLKRTGVVAELNVYEGMSHAQFQDFRMTPEGRELPSAGWRSRGEDEPDERGAAMLAPRGPLMEPFLMADKSNSADSISRGRRTLLLGLAISPLLTATAGAATMSALSSQPAEASATKPIVVFDVNETLLNFNVLTPIFILIFDDPKMLREWFNQVVLYSEALTLAGQYVDSGTVGVAVLQMLAKIKGRTVGPSNLSELKRLFAAMPTYPDTPDALARLKRAGFTLVTFSNNPTSGVEDQLSAAGLRSFFEQLHSIDDQVHRYKPARESYTSLAAKLGASPSDLWFVSCHAFDTLGAASAGYRTALLLRPENAPVALGKAPDIIGTDLRIVADRIMEKSGLQRHEGEDR
jgi:2-haloacid dehalogenase